MSLLPVIAEELEAFEARMQVKLPSYYKQSLLDERVRRVLMSFPVGVLRADDAMHTFANITEKVRATEPKFPANGVVIFCGLNPRTGILDPSWGYLRFLRPDKKDPSRLGDSVFTWVPDRQRQLRDCSIQEWIGSHIDGARDELIAELGLVKPRVFDEKPVLRAEPCSAEVQRDLALRGAAALRRLEVLSNSWVTIATIIFKGRFASLCDAGQLPCAAEGIKLSPGTYDVSLQVAKSSLGEWLMVSSLRVALQGAELSKLSLRHAARIEVDSAAVALYDRQTFFRKIPSYEQPSFLMDLAEVTELPSLLRCGKGTSVLVIPSGDGDGTYGIQSLHDGTNTVGFVVDFVKA
jgi:hypothetical protein